MSPTQPQSPGNINGYLPEAMLKRPQEPSAEGKADCGGIHQSSARDHQALTGSGRLLGGKVPPCPTAPFCHEPTAPAMCKGALWEASTQHFLPPGDTTSLQFISDPTLLCFIQASAYSNSCIASQILPIRQTKTPRKVRKVKLHTSHGDLLEVNLRSSSTNTEFMKAPAQKGHGKV